jgi:hypothetical protein
MTAKLKLNFTRSRYLEIDFEDVTDEKIITHKKMKVTMNLAAIVFILSLIVNYISTSILADISLIFIAASMFTLCLINIYYRGNINYLDKIIPFIDIVNMIDTEKDIYFSSDFSTLKYYKKGGMFSTYKLPVDKIEYYDSKNLKLTYDEKLGKIILYLPYQCAYDSSYILRQK